MKVNASRILESLLGEIGVNYFQEYQFLTFRKFKFDFAIPAFKIAMEIEGGLDRFKQHESRHTNFQGFRNDCEKYNLASATGWILLRFMTQDLNERPDYCKTMILFALKNRKDQKQCKPNQYNQLLIQ